MIAVLIAVSVAFVVSVIGTPFELGGFEFQPTSVTHNGGACPDSVVIAPSRYAVLSSAAIFGKSPSSTPSLAFEWP